MVALRGKITRSAQRNISAIGILVPKDPEVHMLKVFKPKHYNGDPDAHAYHKFVKESNAYIEDNKIKAKCHAFALSYFLDGKAYDFYVQKVSHNKEDWTLDEFYTELFNFCFSLDY